MFLNKKKIFSVSIPELLDARDGDFIHHDEYTAQLEEPVLAYCFANTAVFNVKSSKYFKNNLIYNVYVLFEDFYLIARDRDITLEEAVDFAIRYGDVHVRCRCPAYKYYGYAYISTQLKYLYGIPRENRAPVVRNPQLKGTICKHTDLVLQWLLNHEEEMVENFKIYYGKIKRNNKLVVVNPQGNVIQTGVKDGEGDAFFMGVEQEDLQKAEEQNKDVVDTKTEDAEVIDSMEDFDIEPDTTFDDGSTLEDEYTYDGFLKREQNKGD